MDCIITHNRSEGDAMNVSRSVIQNASRYEIAEWLTDDDSQHYVRPVEAILYGIEPSVTHFQLPAMRTMKNTILEMVQKCPAKSSYCMIVGQGDMVRVKGRTLWSAVITITSRVSVNYERYMPRIHTEIV